MEHTPAIFVAGDPALDFLNSVATPVDARVEWLHSGEALLSWLRQAQLLSAPLLKQVRSQSRSGELDEVAAQARELREWFRGFVQKHRGRPLIRDDFRQLERLNRLLERDQTFSQIAPAMSNAANVFELRAVHDSRSAEALLFLIAEALARFVCTVDFSCVKACAGPACTLLFADRTRSRARRWCSMAICGNRAKQAAHRHRLKAKR